MFREYKKELAAENFRTGENKVLDFDMTEFNKFLQEKELEEKLKDINVIDMNVPEREKHYNNLGTNSEKYANYYYNSYVKRFRPVMIKETEIECDYDYDFEIDEKNYDPWKEYKMIYRDAFSKGRLYWIIKSFPEWYFLQTGKPENVKFNNMSRYNPKRPQMEDSIFSYIMLERYFDERERKWNRYNGTSTAVRI